MSRCAEPLAISAPGGPAGAFLLRGALTRPEQRALVADLRRVAAAAPFFRPVMPRSGKPFSVLMTSCGALGWLSDRAGYRYVAHHPETGRSWPAMPAALSDLWDRFGDDAGPPDCALINLYLEGARMGLHRDADEDDVSAPVLSLSLGDEALFRLGGLARRDRTASLRLHSGDLVILGGAARLAYHGIDRIYPDTDDLLADGGRINVTLRRVCALK